MKNLFGIVIVSYYECELVIWFCKVIVQIVDYVIYFDQNQFVKENIFMYICESNFVYDDQCIDYEVL